MWWLSHSWILHPPLVVDWRSIFLVAALFFARRKVYLDCQRALQRTVVGSLILLAHCDDIRYSFAPFVQQPISLDDAGWWTTNSLLCTEMVGMKTISAKPAEVKRDWFLVDATDKTLGRLASEIAHRLRGKHKPIYTPHVDTGDYIVVINAEKIAVTGNKRTDKMYYHHTGYIGNLKSISFEKLIDKAPERVLEKAVKGMLPKNSLGRAMFKKLKVYAGSEHTHSAQQPKPLEI